MIYLITSQQRLYQEDIQQANIEDCLEYFKDRSEIGVDTEDEGFDPYTNKLLTIQLGDFDNQFVIDCLTTNVLLLKPLLEDSSKLFILQNAKFDLRFFYHAGIKVKNIYDTFLAECILTTGLEHRELSLKGLGEKYCGVELDKSIRGKINYLGLVDDVIIYAAKDVKYLSQIKQLQLIKIKELELERVLDLENNVVKIFALMEYNGVPFNPVKWNEVAEETESNKTELESKMDSIVYSMGTKNGYNNITKYCNINKQMTLFYENTERDTYINWSSPAQKLSLLKELGINVTSVDDKTLQKFKTKHELIPLLIDHSKQNKLATSFGKDFLKFIHPITKRVHPEYWQIVATGRISVSKPNINQIPSHGKLAKKIRSAFEAPEGYKFVGGDYAGMELCLIAEFSQDPLWVETLRNGGDLHSILCSKTFNIPLDKVRDPFPPKPEFTYRDVQKTVDFGLSYGMSEFKLSDTIQISVKEAKNIIKKFFSVVPKVKLFLDTLGELGKSRGYIKTAPPFSRIRWFEGWYKGLEDFALLGEIERASKNTPEQGSNADITKTAMIYLQKRIDRDNLPVQIVMQVYDELQCIVREDFAEEWKRILEEEMIKAAQLIIKTIPIKVDCKISSHWEK